MSDNFLRIEAAMAADERAAFLRNFTGVNPHWQGAQVADVLAELDNTDANLDFVEPMYEAHEGDTDRPELIGSAVRAVLWSQGPFTSQQAAQEAVTWDRVHDLIRRCPTA